MSAQMTDEEASAYRDFRFGVRRPSRPTHRPMPGHNGYVCVAIDPVTGRSCGRGLNYLQTDAQYMTGDRGTPRHNPRPYGRAGSAGGTRRRRCPSGT